VGGIVAVLLGGTGLSTEQHAVPHRRVTHGECGSLEERAERRHASRTIGGANRLD
jgi:hypothetical protein